MEIPLKISQLDQIIPKTQNIIIIVIRTITPITSQNFRCNFRAILLTDKLTNQQTKA